MSVVSHRIANAAVARVSASNKRGVSTPARSVRGSRGFSLMEILTVVAIVGILMAFAIPSFTTFTKTARLRSASQGLYEALTVARSEAIKRNASVTVSPAAAGWVGGWSVKFGTTTLKVWDPEAGITYLDPIGGDITYGLSGRITGTREITAYVADDLKIQARCITIDAGGRVNTRLDTDGDASNGC